MTPASAQRAMCTIAGQEFSVGATVCECPSLSGEGGLATGGKAQITSRRLTCTSKGEWISTNSNCLDISYAASSGAARGDLPKLHSLYCPRIVNIADDTERFIGTAKPSQVLIAVHAICRRFNVAAAPCTAIVEGVMKAAK
jgi:hypothetical protein